ncbi:MAG TPA: sensor histidine kinase [Nitrososphaeraceae archaeon]|nr:sensor histidine kinase [Nitrososphaeraceae archaeon]
MSLLFRLRRPLIFSIIISILIFSTAFGLYFFSKGSAEDNVRVLLFEQQKQRQIENTVSLSKQIESDLDRVVMRLELLAREPALQKGELNSQETSTLLKQADSDINSQITPIDTLGLLNSSNILVNISPDEYRNYIGLDRSQTGYVKEVNKNWQPYVSSGFLGALGRYIIAIGIPITNLETGRHVGIISTAPLTSKFFERYGNILNINSQFIVAVDRDGKYLTAAPPELVGKDFFGEEVQKLTNGNLEVYTLYENAVRFGKPGSAIFDAGFGEQLATAYPVSYGNQGQIMTVILSTPTSAIYSEVENALFIQKLQTISILTAATSAISALIFFILRRNAALERKVEERTSELRTANEELLVHDKMQKEFINIAAHELRTPIVPILNLSELLYSNVLLYPNARERQQQQENGQEEQKQKEMIEMLKIILRNANRLHQLTEDILDTTRIESHTLKLMKEKFNLNDAILNIVDHYKEQIANVNVKLVYEAGDSITIVEADRRRLTQVISNLLNNALKFTKEGTITITTTTTIERKDAERDTGEEVIVSVKDTGTGIDPELMPRLFTKFATKSYQGTGLGLFISKSIIEAHGGKMWASNNNNNNSDGKHKGASFYFTLPVVNMNQLPREEKEEARSYNGPLQ